MRANLHAGRHRAGGGSAVPATGSATPTRPDLRALRQNVAPTPRTVAAMGLLAWGSGRPEPPAHDTAQSNRIRLELLADDGGTTGCQCLGAVEHLGGDVRTHALEGKSA
jgi:hypothetical protein